MRKDKIVEGILEELKADDGIDYRYDHFRTSEAIPPPFIVFRRTAAANFSADGVVYHRGGAVDVELYAADPDEMVSLMADIEALFDKAGLFYNCTADTAYIESEDFYESLYEL